METETPPEVSLEEAVAFARQWGLTSLRPEDMENLRESMNAIARAGRAVPRVPSKFDQPAAVFRVLPESR
jgi:hypothetical protein